MSFYVDEDAPHLGGFQVGGDHATFYPELWRWLVTEYGVRSVLDVGCGEGHALTVFRDAGAQAFGIDGIPQPDSSVCVHDYTEGPSHCFYRDFDLVWSCEFVEHVSEQFVRNYLPDLWKAPLVLMTHAEPGQHGWHHVNCQPADYWRGIMAAGGYRVDDNLTRLTRELALINPSPWNHYGRAGLAFVR